MTRMQEKIIKVVRPKMQHTFGYKNPNMAPKISKVVINTGIRSDIKDPKAVDGRVFDLAAITGQLPVKTRSRQSISSFKLRQGQVVGLMVTLRGRRMYEFLDKLINVTLPRVRDFRGLEQGSFDQRGNLSIGFRDQTAFPEISPDSVAHLFGLQVTVNLAVRSLPEAKEYFKLLGFPIKP